MSEIIQFPGAEKPEREQSETDIDASHAEAFRDLESKINDCVIMAIIALDATSHACFNRSNKNEKALFSVCQVARMLKTLKKDYLAVYEGTDNAALVGPS